MILKELSDAFGVSGNENNVRAIVLDAVRDYVDEVEVDTLGNVLTLKRGTDQERMRVMLAAHMDEVGLMVVDHDKDGFLKVKAVGGIDPRLLPGTLLQVGPDRLPGVIGIKPIHLLEKEERKKVSKLKDLVVDIGAGSEDEARKLAPLGTYATFATQFRTLSDRKGNGVLSGSTELAEVLSKERSGSLGESPGLGPTVSGKAFDDRAGCAVLVELLRGERFAFDLHGVFTVQEEVGLRGARVAAYRIEPDCAFALEGTIADDIPKEKDVSPTTELGKGPAITVMDRSFIADRRLVQLLTGTADELGIPYQFKQPGIGGTDAGAIHLTREGVPSATVAVPSRYIHSPVALLSLDDFNNIVRLMRESLSRLTRETLK